MAELLGYKIVKETRNGLKPLLAGDEAPFSYELGEWVTPPEGWGPFTVFPQIDEKLDPVAPPSFGEEYARRWALDRRELQERLFLCEFIPSDEEEVWVPPEVASRKEFYRARVPENYLSYRSVLAKKVRLLEELPLRRQVPTDIKSGYKVVRPGYRDELVSVCFHPFYDGYKQGEWIDRREDWGPYTVFETLENAEAEYSGGGRYQIWECDYVPSPDLFVWTARCTFVLRNVPLEDLPKGTQLADRVKLTRRVR